MKTIIAVWLLLVPAFAAPACHSASEGDDDWIDLTFKEASCGIAPNLPFYMKLPPGFGSTDLGLGGCLWGGESDRTLTKGKGRKTRLKEKEIRKGVFWFRVVFPGEPLSWLEEKAEFHLEDSLEKYVGGRGASGVMGRREERAGYPTLLATYTRRGGEPGFSLYVGALNAGYADLITYIPARGDTEADQVWERFLGSISDQPPGFRDLPLPPEGVVEAAIEPYEAADYIAHFTLDSRVPAGSSDPAARVSQEVALEYRGGSFTRLHTKLATRCLEWRAFLPNGRILDCGGMWSQPSGEYSLEFEGGEYTEERPSATSVRTAQDQAKFEQEHLSWLAGIMGAPYLSSIGVAELLNLVYALYDFRLSEETDEALRLSGAVKQRSELEVGPQGEGIPEMLERFRRRLPQCELLIGRNPLGVKELLFTGHTARAPLSVHLQLAQFRPGVVRSEPR